MSKTKIRKQGLMLAYEYLYRDEIPEYEGEWVSIIIKYSKEGDVKVIDLNHHDNICCKKINFDNNHIFSFDNELFFETKYNVHVLMVNVE